MRVDEQFLVRRRSQFGSAVSHLNKDHKGGTMGGLYMFNLPPKIVILDLEITTWEGALLRDWSGEGEYKEVIQIGAAKVETEHFEILDTFNEFVRPARNPKLSEYCMELTGITQSAIDRARTFPEVLKDFALWCDSLDLYCFGHMKESPRLFDREALLNNAKLLNIDPPFTEDRFHNVNAIFHKYGYHVKQSGSAPLAFGMKLEARPHDALNDVHGLVFGLKALRDVVLKKGL